MAVEDSRTNCSDAVSDGALDVPAFFLWSRHGTAQLIINPHGCCHIIECIVFPKLQTNNNSDDNKKKERKKKENRPNEVVERRPIKIIIIGIKLASTTAMLRLSPEDFKHRCPVNQNRASNLLPMEMLLE